MQPSLRRTSPFLDSRCFEQAKTNEQKIVLYNQEVQDALSETLDQWQKQMDSHFTYPDSVDMDVYDTIVNDAMGTK